jgi:predicted acetyltransferase
MPLNMRWVGDDQAERIARTRMRCYASGARQFEWMQQRLRDDKRGQGRDYLLAERDGEAVGTATSLSLKMWVRGTAFPAQGVAWVGTIRTERRRGRSAAGAARQPGVASQVMNEVLRAGREREQVLSALMPFRASYYEHFGYGIVERRCEWTLPCSVLPQGDFDGFGYLDPQRDMSEVMQCHQRAVQAGQGSFERGVGGWQWARIDAEEGFMVVDRPQRNGPIRSWMTMLYHRDNGKDWARVSDMSYDSPESLLRQLHFLASLRDQYAGAILTLPADVPLNWLLNERQVPHRPVNHDVPAPRVFTRMQVRVLDHLKLMAGIAWPAWVRGRACVAIAEREGPVSTIDLDVSDGKAAAKASAGEADVRCPDYVWAAVALGELRASVAARWGLLEVARPQALAVLDGLAEGPSPFSHEYF